MVPFTFFNHRFVHVWIKRDVVFMFVFPSPPPHRQHEKEGELVKFNTVLPLAREAQIAN